MLDVVALTLAVCCHMRFIQILCRIDAVDAGFDFCCGVAPIAQQQRIAPHIPEYQLPHKLMHLDMVQGQILHEWQWKLCVGFA